MREMMHMPTLHKSPDPWEIWWAFVEYEDKPGMGKRRPVLVIPSNEQPLILTLKMTTHPVRRGYAGEYEIIDYNGTGLKKKTIIRCSKAILMDESSFDSRIGVLQPRDIMNIINILRQIG